MPLAAARGSHRALSASAPAAKTAGRIWVGLYVGCVILLGTTLLFWFTPRTYPNPPLTIALLCSSLLLSSFKLRLPLGKGVSTMSMACAADLVALMTLGPNVAMVTASTGVLFQCTWRVRRSQPLYRAAFSVASVAITVQAVGRIWGALNGRVADPTLTATLVPLLAMSAGYFMVNTGLVATAVGLTNRESPIRAWYREFFWSGPSYFLSGAAAGVISLIITSGAYILLPLAFVPLYVSYRAYHLSLGRIDAERRHANELAKALDRATQSEAALAEEKERLVLESSRLIVTVQTIRDGVMTVDRDGALLLMNDQARIAGVPHPVWDHRRDHGQVTGFDGGVLSAGLGLAPAGHDVEDLLGAVGVPGEVLAGRDLEVDDGAVRRALVVVDRERRRNPRIVRVTVLPDRQQVEFRRLGSEHVASPFVVQHCMMKAPYDDLARLSRLVAHI